MTRLCVPLFAVTFLFLFSPRINVGITLHLGYAAMALALLYRLPDAIRLCADKRFIAIFSAFLFTGCYHAVMAVIIGTDPYPFLRIMTGLPFYIAFGFLLHRAIDRANNAPAVPLLKLFVYCVVTNAVLVLLEYFVPGFRDSIESILAQDPNANIDYQTHPFRFRGLSGGGGAALSVANGVAVWICAALALRGHMRRDVASTVAIVIVAATIFVGRTGLIIGALSLSVYVCLLLWFGLKSKRLAGTAISIVATTVLVAVHVELDRAVSVWAIDAVLQLLTDPADSHELSVIHSMLFLPTEPIHMLLGVGYFSGVNVLYSPSDSGYLKTIMAIGLPLALAMYGFIIIALLRLMHTDKSVAYALLPVVVILLITEIKEPFMYQNVTGRLIFLLIGVYLGTMTRVRQRAGDIQDQSMRPAWPNAHSPRA